MSDAYDFAEPDESDAEESARWKVLVVDDDPEVHSVTRLALNHLEFSGRQLELISAHSGQQSLDMLREHPDVAVVLMDVVMDTDDDGLQAVRRIRQELGNHLVRIILRTGQPGQAPEVRVIQDYDINDYKDKTELTAAKLFAAIYAALRSYQDLLTMQQHRDGLKLVNAAGEALLAEETTGGFARRVLEYLAALCELSGPSGRAPNAAYVERPAPDAEAVVVAALGEFALAVGSDPDMMLGDTYAQRADLARASSERPVFADDHFLHLFRTENGSEVVLYLDEAIATGDIGRDLTRGLCHSMALILEKLQRRL